MVWNDSFLVLITLDTLLSSIENIGILMIVLKPSCGIKNLSNETFSHLHLAFHIQFFQGGLPFNVRGPWQKHELQAMIITQIVN